MIHKIQKTIHGNTTKPNKPPKTTLHNLTPQPTNNSSKLQDKQTQHITHKCHLKRARPTGLAQKQKKQNEKTPPTQNHAHQTKKRELLNNQIHLPP